MAKIVVNDNTISFFKEKNINFSYSANHESWLNIGQIIRIDEDAVIENNSSFFTPTDLYTIGCFSYSWSPLPSNITIGRYCSIAGNVSIIPASHSTEYFTTSSVLDDRIISHLINYGINQNQEIPESWGNSYYRNGNKIIIEDDVYIGEGVSLRDGITIGRGSIIGARTVVTKNIPPYAVFVGNPGRVVKFRFEENIIKKLIVMDIFDYNAIDLINNTSKISIELFIDLFHKNVELGIIKKNTPIYLSADEIPGYVI